MLDVSEQGKAAARELRSLLTTHQYDTYAFVLRSVGYFVNPWPPYPEFSRRLRRLPSEAGLLLRLFYLGDAVPRDQTVNLLGGEQLRLLGRAGLLEVRDEHVRTTGFGVVPYFGHYFVASLPPSYPTCRDRHQTVYLARDSYGLANQVLGLQSPTALDLCAGCGIHGILAARTVNQVTAAELVPEAAAAARFNAFLNAVEDRVQVRTGDLYAALGTERFDAIVANPPFLPIPQELAYPTAINGGPDGIAVMRRVVDGLAEHLRDNGLFLAIGESLGDGKGPLALKLLEGLVAKGFHVELLSLARELSVLIAYLLGEMVGQLQLRVSHPGAAFVEHFRQLRAPYYYHYLVRARRAGEGGLMVRKMHGDWTPEDVAVAIPVQQFSGTEQAEIAALAAALAEPHKRVYHSADGVKNVQQIAQQLGRVGGSEHESWQMVQQVLVYCDELEALGLLRRIPHSLPFLR